MTSADIIKLIDHFGQLQFQAGLTAGMLREHFTPIISVPAPEAPQVEPEKPEPSE